MRIGIDVDGVVADVLTPWLVRCNLDLLYDDGSPAHWLPEDMYRWDFWNQISLPEERVWELFTPDIYNDVKPFPGALDAINAIRAAGHEIWYITSCRGIQEWEAKVTWLNQHHFRAAHDGAVGVGNWCAYRSKAQVATEMRVDWLVDDSVSNVEAWPGYALLYTQPHNARLSCRCKRVKSLMEVAEMLKYSSKPAHIVSNDCLGIDDQPDGFADVATEVICGGASYCDREGDHNEHIGTLIDVPTAPEDREFIASLSSLPTDWQQRKDTPIGTGVLDYFPAALAEIARVSKAGNDQHNPGQPLHWARGKSTDQADCIIRHYMERGAVDADGQRHSAKLAWRALALLQQELEDEGAPLSRASKVA